MLSIGSNAFDSCAGLLSVVFAAGSTISSIGDSAFKSCNVLTGISIPNTVSSIGSNAFDSCIGILSVVFASDSTISSIGDSIFKNCVVLRGIIIPNTVTSIGVSAFEECVLMNSLTFQATSILVSINDTSFYNCSSLSSIIIPNSVTSIGGSAFSSVAPNSTLTKNIVGDQKNIVVNINSFSDVSSISGSSISFYNTVDASELSAEWQTISTYYENVNYYSRIMPLTFGINFTLSSFDSVINSSVTAVMPVGVSQETYVINNTRPRCVYEISTQVMKEVFQFGFDSIDIANNVAEGDTSDIRYYQDMTKWPTNYVLNIANSMCDYVDITSNEKTLYTTQRDNTVYNSNRMFMKDDGVRHLSTNIFGSQYGVDLFSNETELHTDIETQGSNIWLDNIFYRFNYLNTNGKKGQTEIDCDWETALGIDINGDYYCTDEIILGLQYRVPSESSSLYGPVGKNIVSITKNLFDQLVYSIEGRERILNAIQANDAVRIGLPFNDGDRITFAVTLKAGENTITSSQTTNRVYHVTLVCKDTIANTSPLGHGDVTQSIQ